MPIETIPASGTVKPGMARPEEVEPQKAPRPLPRLRILHLLAPASFGGLEQVVRALAGGQRHAGHDVHVGAVLDPDVGDHPLLQALESNGVAVHPMRPRARAYRRERRMVADLCRAVRPDLVHTHGYRSDVLHGSVARKLGLVSVSTSHGFTGGDWKNRIYERLQRRALRRCDAVVAVSAQMAAVLRSRGIPEERVHCIPNAWTGGVPFLDRSEARKALGIETEGLLVGFVGRLGHEKGSDLFVEAMAGVENAATAVMVGDGSLRGELTKRVAALGLGASVRFAGMVQDAGRLMKAFDAVVLSSRTEGTPVVLLEAMAAGVPVIATRVGGIPDVVSETEALLVAPEDPEALASAIDAVARDRESAAERAARASERLATAFGPERWLGRYEEVYSRCGAGAAGRDRWK